MTEDVVDLAGNEQKEKSVEERSLKDFIGKTVIIKGVKFDQYTYMNDTIDTVHIETDMGLIKTSSKTILKQLHENEEIFEAKKALRVTITRKVSQTGRPYFLFVPPVKD